MKTASFNSHSYMNTNMKMQ